MKRDTFEDVFATQITFSVLNTQDPSPLFRSQGRLSMRKEDVEKEKPAMGRHSAGCLGVILYRYRPPSPFAEVII